MTDLKELLQRCDDLIKAGQAHQVRILLDSLDFNKLGRTWRLPLARICRRAGLLPLGLKILGELVLPGDSSTEPTPAELAEYAVLLQRSGSLTEALEKLNRVDPAQVPESLLYRSFTHFARWEFDLAIPVLHNYLQMDLSDYSKEVGQINLAFALAECGRNDEATELLNGIVKTESRQMRSNAHALLGQVFVQQGQFRKAREHLECARELVPPGPTNDQFFASKWKLIIEGLEDRDLNAFTKLRDQALKAHAWETVREADMFSLKIEFNLERFLHLYFGTPYPLFRTRLHREFAVVPHRTTYVLGDKSSPRFDLRTGQLDDKPALVPGQKIHQLIESLLQDFYRPVRVAGLFSNLFAGEQFNISSSPHRIHQLISRARGTMARLKLPIVINEQDGFYQLATSGAISFRVPLERSLTRRPTMLATEVASRFANASSFSTRDVGLALGISAASAHRLVHRGLDEGWLEYAANRHGRRAAFRIKNQAA